MNDLYNPKLKNYARQLRKNMTKEEAHLWYDFLKKLPLTVKRQKIIGNYIVDFYCAGARLAVEIAVLSIAKASKSKRTWNVINFLKITE